MKTQNVSGEMQVYANSNLVSRLVSEVPNNKNWLGQLCRKGWAWEFLRRNPHYKTDFQTGLADVFAATRWGLNHFCDPKESALSANVFWRHEDCPEVLPLTISKETFAMRIPLSLEGLSCHISHIFDPRANRHDLLFREEGRSLQLAVFGDGDLKGAGLVVAALDNPADINARTAALHRLNDLLFTKKMRASLYPPEARAMRLTAVLTALDGWLARMSQREIAYTMFNKNRVDREWNDPRENLRDQVRRAVGCGQELMNGGYRQFLCRALARRQTNEHRKAEAHVDKNMSLTVIG